MTDGSRAIFESRWMKEGRLQVMDLGSQLLGAFCRARPGQTVVDYCAGAGGKTLVLADAVGDRGRVFAWDLSEKRLKEARKRVGEFKLRHVSFPSSPRVDLADLVLVDAPCSGTGTLGREPDQKWKLSPKQVDELCHPAGSFGTWPRSSRRSLVYGTVGAAGEDEAWWSSGLEPVPSEESLRICRTESMVVGSSGAAPRS